MAERNTRMSGEAMPSQAEDAAAQDERTRAAVFDKVHRGQCQWPIQIKLAPTSAPYFDHARLLVAADCCAFACKDFHERYMEGNATLIGCPKLDGTDYSEKLAAILSENDIESVSVARMEVPCCGGIENMVRQALADSGRPASCDVVTISITGESI